MARDGERWIYDDEDPTTAEQMAGLGKKICAGK